MVLLVTALSYVNGRHFQVVCDTLASVKLIAVWLTCELLTTHLPRIWPFLLICL